MTVLTMPKSLIGSYGSFFITAAVPGWPPVSSTIVCPSGGAFATASFAMRPVPPTFCSTTSGCFSRSASFCPRKRLTRSVLPPGGKPT